MQTFITKNGNVLVVSETQSFFCDVTGKFIRLVTESEKEYLLSIPLPKVEIEGFNAPWEAPVWRFMWSVTHDDYSRYKPGTSSNGGDYSYHTESMYFARINGEYRSGNPSIEVCRLDYHSTSAEFNYSDDGNFVSSYEQADFTIIGTDKDDLIYRMQDTEHQEITLDQLAQKVGRHEFWNAANSITEEGEETQEYDELSEEDMKERVEKFKSIFGFDPQFHKEKIRNRRRA